MSKKVHLEVRADSNYGKATEFMRKNQIYTKTMLLDFFQTLPNSNGKPMTMPQAMASAGVMLSPRLDSKKDCRGNESNPWGHIAYNEKLARKKDKTGKKLEQKFRFRFRAEELPKKVRVRKAKTAQEKVKVTSKVNVESETKVTA